MNCKNCQHILSESDNYCTACGAKVIRNRLTTKNLFQDFSSQFLNYDNKFLKTFFGLIKHPEAVIGCYIDGTRKKYVNPISYFAITITIVGLQMYLISHFFSQGLDLSSFVGKGQEQMSNEWMKFLMEYQSILLMALVPAYTLISKIVFFNIKKYNYTEHFVMFLYILSQLTLLMIIPTIIALTLGYTMGDISPYTMLFQVIYSGYCLKRIFQLSPMGIFLRFLLFLVVGIVFYIITIIFFILIMIVVHGGIEGFVESMKPTQ